MATTSSRRDDTPAGRFYEIEGVGRFPSVTTILDTIAKPALVDWAARTERQAVMEGAADLWDSLRPIEAAHAPKTRMSRLAWTETLKRRLGHRHAWKRERDAALKVGREAHDLIDWHLKRTVCVAVKQPQVGPEAVIAYKAFAEWLERSAYEPRWVEFQVWSERHGYAGTLDTAGLLPLSVDGGEVGQVVAVGDWKSSKRIFSEAVAQVAAYTEALREMGHLPADRGPVWGFIVRLPKRADDQLEVYMISPELQAQAFEAFLAALTLWRWKNEPLPAQRAELGGAASAGVYLFNGEQKGVA